MWITTQIHTGSVFTNQRTGNYFQRKKSMIVSVMKENDLTKANIHS
jgi:hypothetical protein